MSHGWIRAGLLGIVVAGTGCSKTYSDRDVHWLSINDAKEFVADQHGSWFDASKANAWIDPRDEVYYRVGHIPGAINVQLSDPDAMARLESFGALVVYGEGYEAPLADAMIKALLKEGVKEVRGLKLGYEGWVEGGGTVQKGEDAARRPGATKGDRWQRQPVGDE